MLDRLESGLIPEETAKDIFKQLLSGVAYLHEKGVVHRDLKPGNVLLLEDPNRGSPLIKIADFGVARKQIDGNFMTTICGTFNYAAPEVLLQGNTFLGAGAQATPYGKEVDMWSLGVILYCMLSGVHPFREEPGLPPLFDQITKGLYDFDSPTWESVSQDAIDLIKRLLTVDTKDRITAKQGLEHKWFCEQTSKNNKCTKKEKEGKNDVISSDKNDKSKGKCNAEPDCVHEDETERVVTTDCLVKTPRRKVRQSPRGINFACMGGNKRIKYKWNDDDDDDDDIIDDDDDKIDNVSSTYNDNEEEEEEEIQDSGSSPKIGSANSNRYNVATPPYKRVDDDDDDRFRTPPHHKRKFPYPQQESSSAKKKSLSPLSIERKADSFIDDVDDIDEDVSNVSSQRFNNDDINDGGNCINTSKDDYYDTEVVKQTPQSDKKPRKISQSCESLKKTLF